MGIKVAKEKQQEERQQELKTQGDEKKTKRQLRKEKYKEKKQYQIRKFPIWLRIIVIFVLAVIAFVGGLMFGFSVLGDGSPLDVLRKDTWFHIRDIVYK